jgi:hypothetical protein
MANGKGGCRRTNSAGIRRLGGHEAQAQEAEKGENKKGSEMKGQRTNRDAGVMSCARKGSLHNSVK